MILARAYGTVWDFVNSILGTHIHSFPPNTYGTFLALAFLVGIFIAKSELKRKTNLGIFPKDTKEVEIGKGIIWSDVLIFGVVGFFLGLKLGGIIFDSGSAMLDTQRYILSMQGSKTWAIITAFLMGGYIAYTQNKSKLLAPKKVTVSNNLEDRIGDVLIIAMIGGVLGAKMLDAWDNPESMQELMTNPIASLTSGLSILGGLFTVSALLIYYAWKNKIQILPFVDSLSPPYFIAYAIGRLGCQFSGDGCWGEACSKVAKPSFIPDALWGSTYAHNVNKIGIPVVGSNEYFNYVLPEPHIQTPLFETIIVSILFLILWQLRKKLTPYFGAITGLFLVFNGVERFLIEFIRINTKYTYFGMNFTQAQYMSLFMIFVGIALFSYSFWFRKKEVFTK